MYVIELLISFSFPRCYYSAFISLVVSRAAIEALDSIVMLIEILPSRLIYLFMISNRLIEIEVVSQRFVPEGSCWSPSRPLPPTATLCSVMKGSDYGVDQSCDVNAPKTSSTSTGLVTLFLRSSNVKFYSLLCYIMWAFDCFSSYATREVNRIHKIFWKRINFSPELAAQQAR